MSSERPKGAGQCEVEGRHDVFSALYTSSGNQTWVHQVGSKSGELPFDVVAGGSGTAFVAGRTGGDLAGESNSGTHDGFLSAIR
ncbi:MAG: hypothetical protein ABEL76_10225 [Bradymonadaceae bacterium]